MMLTIERTVYLVLLIGHLEVSIHDLTHSIPQTVGDTIQITNTRARERREK